MLLVVFPTSLGVSGRLLLVILLIIHYSDDVLREAVGVFSPSLAPMGLKGQPTTWSNFRWGSWTANHHAWSPPLPSTQAPTCNQRCQLWKRCLPVIRVPGCEVVQSCSHRGKSAVRGRPWCWVMCSMAVVGALGWLTEYGALDSSIGGRRRWGRLDA